MSKNDINIAAVEQAIAKKYGERAIVNPSSLWDKNKEEDYAKQLKDLERQTAETTNEKVEVDGVLIPKKLLNRETNRTCPTCGEYSFKSIDDVYMTKYECCYKCYIQWVEDREERWLTGWRPNKGEKNG
tara:strand:+ start:1441 stop:1827 length:387 start_codon:yes stop_codon:yes gene_type:complete